MLNNEFETRIAGIPCRIRIDHCDIRKPDYRADNPDDYYGWSEVTWTVLDRNGRKAPWLENKLKQEDYDRIDEEALEVIKDYQRSCEEDYYV